MQLVGHFDTESGHFLTPESGSTFCRRAHIFPVFWYGKRIHFLIHFLMRVADALRRHMGGRLRTVYWEINIWVQIPYPKPETFSVSKILSLWACGCQGSRHFLYLKPNPCFAPTVMLLRHKLEPLSDYKTRPVFVVILLAARCFFLVAPATPKPLKRYPKLPSRTHSWVPNAGASTRLVCVTVLGS